MDIKIITETLQLDLYGFGGIAANKDYVETAFRLSGKMWEVVKAHDLKHKGKNIWVYETANRIFAGVELDAPTGSNFGLEKMSLSLAKYARFKYIGPYSGIKEAGQAMTDELTKKGYEIILPYVEIYGHWTSDERKLETELIMCLSNAQKTNS